MRDDRDLEPSDPSDAIPWGTGSAANDRSFKQEPFNGMGALHLSLDEMLSTYSLAVADVRDLMRAAQKIMERDGWAGGRGRIAFAPDPNGRRSVLQAIGAAFDEMSAPPFNLHMGARAALESIVKTNLVQWNEERGRTPDHVSDLFYRALYLIENQPQKRAG